MSGDALAPGSVVLAHQTVAGAGAGAAVELAARAGFGGVTIRAVPDGGTTDRAVVEAMADTSRTRAAARACDVRIADVEAVVLTPDWSEEAAKALVEAGAALGARFVNTLALDPDRDRLVERWARLCELCADAGLRPSLEFAAFSTVATIAGAEAVVTAAGHPAGTVTVDALHLARGGGTVADVIAVRDRGAAPLTCLHLCDGPVTAPEGEDALLREALEDRHLPGEGAFPLQALLDALPAADVYVETPVRALARSAHELRAKAAAASLRSLTPRSV